MFSQTQSGFYQLKGKEIYLNLKGKSKPQIEKQLLDDYFENRLEFRIPIEYLHFVETALQTYFNRVLSVLTGIGLQYSEPFQRNQEKRRRLSTFVDTNLETVEEVQRNLDDINRINSIVKEFYRDEEIKHVTSIQAALEARSLGSSITNRAGFGRKKK